MDMLGLGSLLLAAAVCLVAGRAARAAAPTTENDIDWYNARDFGVTGKGWKDTEGDYDRLPARASGVVPQDVWRLSRQSVGMYVEFETDATAIHALWNLTGAAVAMNHMPATGVSGLDLYVLNPSGKWQWLAVGQPDKLGTVTKQLIGDLPEGRRRYRLYLPLYNSVSSLEVGVPHGAALQPVPPAPQKPIVFYGTSITQGACASRPGMAYTAILGRRLDMPVINLGFSGAGRMEPALADLVAELDASVFVLDAFPNMDAALIQANFENFVRTIRKAHPNTPIVVVEDREFANTPYQPARQSRHRENREAIRTVYDALIKSGVGNLHFVPRDGIFGDDYEATVDGSHPTDLGMMRYADVVEPVLRRVLGKG